jgi:hypothetical protein
MLLNRRHALVNQTPLAVCRRAVSCTCRDGSSMAGETAADAMAAVCRASEYSHTTRRSATEPSNKRGRWMRQPLQYRRRGRPLRYEGDRVGGVRHSLRCRAQCMLVVSRRCLNGQRDHLAYGRARASAAGENSCLSRGALSFAAHAAVLGCVCVLLQSPELRSTRRGRRRADYVANGCT